MSLNQSGCFSFTVAVLANPEQHLGREEQHHRLPGAHRRAQSLHGTGSEVLIM